MKNAKIRAITHSDSGQVVAYVVMDNGDLFWHPFGRDCTEADIVSSCQAEVDNRLEAQGHAEKLHASLAEPYVEVHAQSPLSKGSEIVASTHSLPLYRRLWVVLSWYFRRKK